LIVFDTSTLVGAVLKRDSVPERALLKARAADQLAISDAVEAELRRVLLRRKFDRYISREERDEFIGFVLAAAARFAPTVTVVDCRDPDDNMYLELADAARAGVIVSSDVHLLEMDRWRGIRILRPAHYLELP
jgi:uncharacterized protein